jgi:prevent-host-death family protein
MNARSLPIVNRNAGSGSEQKEIALLGQALEKAISATHAKLRFLEVLQDVKNGQQSYVVTSHGRAVARLVPIDKGRAATASGRASLFGRLRSEKVVKTGRWKRDKLYR